MSTTVDVNIKVTGAKKAAGEVGDVANKAEQGGEAISGMSGALDRMTGGMISGFQGMAKGLKNGVKGLKSFKMALISTGIGALVVLIGSLVAYFTQTRRGAEMLEKVMGGLGAVMGLVVDVASGLGEILINAVLSPKQAWEDIVTAAKAFWEWNVAISEFIRDSFMIQVKILEKQFLKLRIAWNQLTGDAEETEKLVTSLAVVNTEITDIIDNMNKNGEKIVEPFIEAYHAVVEFGEGLVDAYIKGDELAARSIKLREAQRDLKVAFAEGRAQIKEYNLVAEDTTKGLEERMEAAEKAIEIEKGLMAARQAAAAEELAIAKETAAISETTEDDLENIADLEAALIQIRTESAEMTTTLNNKLNTIRAQDAAEAQRLAAEQKALDDAKLEREKEFIAMKQTDQENEITAATEHYARMLVLAKEFGMSDEEVAERKRIAIKAINDKYNAEEVKGVEETEAKKIQLKHNQVQQALQIAQSMASFLLTLNNTSDKKDEAQQKKAFKRGKALQLAGAAMSTASAIIASLAAPPVGLGVPAGIPGAIIAGLSGAAQAITISRQKFNSPSSASTGGAASVGSLSMSAPEMTEALVPTSFADSATAPTTGSSAGIAPVQAFVVSSSITNQQQLDATISHQSSL